jgi:hypothetical protein
MSSEGTSGSSIGFLRSHAETVGEGVKHQPAHVVYREGILSTLSELEAALEALPVDMGRVEQCQFGLFRLVTDSRELEESDLGQELMALHKEIGDFVRSTKGPDKAG